MPDVGVRQRLTALVVDDEAAVRRVLERFLARRGFDVLAAAEGRAAIDLFRNHFESIDLVILDLAMPGMDGEEVLVQLRRMSRDIPVVICTGSRRSEAEARVGSLDGLGFVRKPFKPGELYDAIDAVLACDRVDG